MAAASEPFRKNGISDTELIDLMHAVGLAHGGLYRHRKSTDVPVRKRRGQVQRLDDVTHRTDRKVSDALFLRPGTT